MASFQVKIGWKRPRKRENKIIVPFRYYPTSNRKFQKNSKKIKKIALWLYFKPKQVGKGSEREKIENIVPFRSVPTRRVIENSKKVAKN